MPSSRRRLEAIQYDDSPLLPSPKESPRAARRRFGSPKSLNLSVLTLPSPASARNTKNAALPDDTSNSDSEDGSAQAGEDESHNSQNEIDNISFEPTAESSDSEDISESKSAVKYPSPPLT